MEVASNVDAPRTLKLNLTFFSSEDLDDMLSTEKNQAREA